VKRKTIKSVWQRLGKWKTKSNVERSKERQSSRFAKVLADEIYPFANTLANRRGKVKLG